MNCEFGNVNGLSGFQNGWFVGPFIKDSKLRSSNQLQIKWYLHPKGQCSGPRPRSEGLTVTILVRGKLSIWLRESDDQEWVQFILEKEGDYGITGSGILHKWEALEESQIVTVRPAD